MTDDTIFEHEISIFEDEHTANIRVTKDQVLGILRNRVGREISEKEGKEIWKDLRKSTTWFNIFPEEAEKHGYHMYGSSDYDFYCECFKDAVQDAIQAAVEKAFADNFETIFLIELEEAEEKLRGSGGPEPITLENVERQTKKRIQDENVRNGLARCDNESKDKSIQKWKEQYLKTHPTTA